MSYIYFTVQYKFKLFGLFNIWRSLTEPNYKSRSTIRFYDEEDAKKHIEKICTLKRLRLDRKEKKVIDRFNCTNL